MVVDPHNQEIQWVEVDGREVVAWKTDKMTWCAAASPEVISRIKRGEVIESNEYSTAASATLQSDAILSMVVAIELSKVSRVVTINMSTYNYATRDDLRDLQRSIMDIFSDSLD